jgi:hypothetical protein
MSAQPEDAHSSVGENRFEVGDWNTVEILCECGYSNCCGRIVVTLPEYERVRRHPARFFIRAGHEVSGRQRLVGQGADYVVVEVDEFHTALVAAPLPARADKSAIRRSKEERGLHDSPR